MSTTLRAPLALLIALAGPAAAAEGDLAVGWISRAPRMDYVWNSSDPVHEGWPAPGQIVTWEAHVKSWFDHDLSEVGYRWLLDGAEIARGRVDVPAGATVVVGLPREWRFTRHELTFEIDPDGLVAEDEEGNNSLSVFTDALSVGLYVEQNLYDFFHANQHLLAGAGSNSFEDWAQRHIRRFNEMASRAINPESPNGILDRWRLDEIVIVPDGVLPLVPLPNAGQMEGQPNGHTHPNTADRSVDLLWGLPAADRAIYTDLTTVDDSNIFFYQGSLIHELGHARYLVDVYGWQVRDGIGGDSVDIREGNVRVFGSTFMPAQGSNSHYCAEQGLMNQSYGFIDRYSAIALNRIAGRRATRGNCNTPENYGEFLNDLPAENRVTVRNAGGFPVPNADVWIYQAVGGPPFFLPKIYDNVPDLKLRTGADGRVLVGRCPFSADGRIVHDYGVSNVTAIVRVASGGTVAYGFLESLQFNLAYWRGQTELADHELVVGGAVCGYRPPFITAPGPEVSRVTSPVMLSWTTAGYPSVSPTGYEVWAARDGAPAQRLAVMAPSKTPSYKASFSGPVSWWVVATLDVCPAQRSGIALFTMSSYSASFFVPVVLSSSGAAGSFFTSEMVLTNRGSTDAHIVFRYTDADGSAGVADDTLPAGRQLVVPDAIAYLGARGVALSAGNRVGTLRVMFEGLSAVDAPAVTVRTTTPVEGGRAGLAYSGVPAGRLLAGPAYLCGLRQNDVDRSNVAVQNAGLPEEGPVTLRLTAFSNDGSVGTVVAEETLPPGGFFQISNVLTALGSGSKGYVKVERVAGFAPFYAYGVLNDQVTSDGSFVAPIAEGVGPVASWTLPVAVETPVFSTELIVTNLMPRDRTLQLTLVPRGTAGRVTLTLELSPFEQRSLPDFVQLLREKGAGTLDAAGSTVVGPVFVTDAGDSGGDAADLFVGGRVSSAGAGGRLGFSYSAVPAGSAAGDSEWLYSLRQDGENRTNVALINTGENPSRDTFDVDVFDGDTGALVAMAAGVAALDSRGFIQLNAFLAEVAPGTSNGYARIRRASGTSPFLSYAVINDGAWPGDRSGDGAFVRGAH